MKTIIAILFIVLAIPAVVLCLFAIYKLVTRQDLWKD